MSQTISSSGTKGSAPEATLISVILDRSGSMASVREPTIGGFNEFLHEQQRLKDGGRALMSLTQFDDRFEVNFVGEPIENVPDLDATSYIPRGHTALYDAIGRTVRELEGFTRVNAWKDRVLVLIITDGLENASREFTIDSVHALITQKEKDGWNFAYMGANQDSFAVAGKLSIRPDFIQNYRATESGVRDIYGSLGKAGSAYRLSSSRGLDAASFFKNKDAKSEAEETGGKLTPKGGKP